jgi:hypothetical protein
MTTALRQIPFPMLRWFLPDVGIDLDFDWEKIHAYDLPKVIEAYESLPESQRKQSEKIVQNIVVLANKKGVIAMREAARICGLTYWERLFPPDSSAYLQAVWAWTEHKEKFDMAKELFKEKAVSPTLLNDTHTEGLQ